MSYRDDLHAAHARINALEAEVARHASDDDEPDERDKMAGELKQLRAIVEERREKMTELRAERDRLAARVRALEANNDAVPTLWDQNRNFPPLADGRPANVACPSCRAAGIESKLVHDAGVTIAAPASSSGLGLLGVICPRCLFVGVLRTR
jgi:hypothetical protein